MYIKEILILTSQTIDFKIARLTNQISDPIATSARFANGIKRKFSSQNLINSLAETGLEFKFLVYVLNEERII